MAKYRVYEDGLVIHEDEWNQIADPQRETIHFEIIETDEEIDN